MKNDQTQVTGTDQAACRFPTDLDALKNYFKSQDSIRKGIQALQSNLPDNAIEFFNHASQFDKENKAIKKWLAACHISQKNYVSASEELIADSGNEIVEIIRNALTHWLAGKKNVAIECLRSGIKNNPECAELHFQLGNILAEIDELEEAELRFETAWNLDKNHVESLIALALCHGRNHKADLAVPVLQKAQSIEPDNAKIGMLLSVALKAACQTGSHIKLRLHKPVSPDELFIQNKPAFIRMMKNEPELAELMINASTGKTKENLIELIHDVSSKLYESENNNFHFGHIHALTLHMMGKDNNAIKWLKQHLKKHSDDVKSSVLLCRLYLANNYLEAASTILQYITARYPQYPDVQTLLGSIYQKQGFAGHAKSAYRKALLINNKYEIAKDSLHSLQGNTTG